MKKALPTFLAFLCIVQPAYGIAPAKKGAQKSDKTSVIAQKVLNKNERCFASGKGCSKDKLLALQAIRSFFKGDKKKAKENLRLFLRKNWECWLPIIKVMLAMGLISAAGALVLFGGMGITGRPPISSDGPRESWHH